MTSKKNTKMESSVDDVFDDEYNDDMVLDERENALENIKNIKAKLRACIKESRENLLGWQRAKADFINARKEYEARLSSSRAATRSDIIEEFLPVIDSFEMAFGDREAWNKVDNNWRVGVEHIYSQFLAILESNGVTQVDPIGETFDPGAHISIERVPTEDKKGDDTVVAVVRKGYALDGKILRPARVKVAQYL